MSPLGQRWSRISRRERGMLLAFGIVVAVVLGYRFIFRPWSQQAGRANAERQTLQRQLATLQETLVRLEEDRKQLEGQRDDTARLREELRSMEDRMVSLEDLGQLLGKLAEQGQGLGITFESITQEVDDSGERPEVKIDLALSSSYEALASYLRRVEQLTPFLTVTQLEIADPADGPASAQAVKLSLMTPVRAGGSGGLDLGKVAPAEPVKIARSPFNVIERPVESLNLDAIRLTGITWRGDASTAIVNDEVVRVGDKVKELVVTSILSDRVIVSDGAQKHTIPLNQQ